MWLTPAAPILISASPLRGSGFGRSLTCRTSGPPTCSTTTAFTSVPFSVADHTTTRTMRASLPERFGSRLLPHDIARGMRRAQVAPAAVLQLVVVDVRILRIAEGIEGERAHERVDRDRLRDGACHHESARRIEPTHGRNEDLRRGIGESGDRCHGAVALLVLRLDRKRGRHDLQRRHRARNDDAFGLLAVRRPKPRIEEAGGAVEGAVPARG